jgi:hypothetical protein
MTLVFAGTAARPAAVLTGPRHLTGVRTATRENQAASTYDMVPVRLDHSPLTATAALAWNGDLPRPLQHILFDTADSMTS